MRLHESLPFTHCRLLIKKIIQAIRDLVVLFISLTFTYPHIRLEISARTPLSSYSAVYKHQPCFELLQPAGN